MATQTRYTGLIERYRDRLPVAADTRVISLGEGNTPLIQLQNIPRLIGKDVDIYVKFEGLNPTGSFKDRGMTMAVTKAVEEGSQAIICASTGNTSASAAAYAVRAGIRAFVLIPEGKIALGKLAQTLMYGAKIIQIKGNFDDGMSIVKQIADHAPVTIVNSINPFRLEGQKTAAFEIVDELGDAPDFHCLPVGNAGNITAYWKGYKEYATDSASHKAVTKKLPVMCGYQAAGAAPFIAGQPVENPETIATAIRIGNPQSWDGAWTAQKQSGGWFVAFTDQQILAAQKMLSQFEGIFCEPASATSLAGALHDISLGNIPEGSRIVCTLTGNGIKDPDTAIMQCKDAPTETVEATLDAVKKSHIGFDVSLTAMLLKPAVAGFLWLDMYLQGVKKVIVRRSGGVKAQLGDIDPVLQTIFSSRGIQSADELERSLAKLPSPWLLSGMQVMIGHLIDAIKQQQSITVVADFDADGATSCALAIKGLGLLGLSRVNFVVPNRFEYGYGLTPEIVELVKQHNPDIIMTVDNGISSVDGVKVAKAAGIKVLITDHHLPGHDVPEADAIVNPNLPDDKFPSRHVAGVGVMFYVLMALRIRLRELHWFEKNSVAEPNLAQLLDYVALGTVADVVTLDQVNRILVHQGLLRIRSGQCRPGIKALAEIAGRSLQNLYAADLGFAIAPRLNAAGRMDDMTLGIQCLLIDDAGLARDIAEQLDALNQDRKEVEGQMKNEAMALLAEMKFLDDKHVPAGVCLYDDHWHQGVIGILAARIKDRLHRPVIAFAPADNGQIKGSARSINGVHVRDVLSEIAAAHPQLLTKFGGHAMAAGLTLKMHDYPHFALLFAEAVAGKLDQVDLEQKVWSDGELNEAHMSLEFAELLQQAAIWGQAFPEPVFDGVFDVVQCRVVGRQHLKFVLRLPFSSLLIDAIAFFADHPENWLGCRKINAAYKLDVNEFRNQRSLQLQLHYLEKLE